MLSSSGVRQQGHVSGAFNGLGQFPLMLHAHAAAAPGHNFAIGGNKTLQNLPVFIINIWYGFNAKIAVTLVAK